MINVQPIDKHTSCATVAGYTTAPHRVTLSDSYHEKLTGKQVASGVLIEKSF